MSKLAKRLWRRMAKRIQRRAKVWCRSAGKAVRARLQWPGTTTVHMTVPRSGSGSASWARFQADRPDLFDGPGDES